MSAKDLFGLIKESNTFTWLIMASVLFFSTALMIILATLLYQIIKRKRLNSRQSLEDTLNDWIAKVLAFEDEFLPMPEQLSVYFKNTEYHPYITAQLIVIRKNISGTALHKIINVYEQSGLKASSVEKLRSNSWQVKALGIYELYMMMQKDMRVEISRYTNSKDDYVRAEAQTAMISFEGFSGLKFLDTLTRPLTEWQQLKLTEQLLTLNTEQIVGLETWLQSSNAQVVIFALKLAANFQQLQLHEAVVNCLSHEHEKVRAEAIFTLTKIADISTPDRLIEQYVTETDFNKRNILISLRSISGDEQSIFLQEQLNNANNEIKLLAALALLNTCTHAEQILMEKAKHQQDPYRMIFLHAKRELTYDLD
ncbi:hypothetical protein SAMN05421827_101475 [Pedobacter terrae]|uniref:HEAT repeat protein n=1 Tax=Pedobacter terrae TaxID=405671 RepID=A0A1G7NRT9_9SPHI|nr:HEAT repeat domain-containing protein [Pedobacter terrae]SDF76798.1 hypothetical protein SAMN05421827_101475 [Pedobacter terrae]